MKQTLLFVVIIFLLYSCTDPTRIDSINPDCIEYVPIEIDSTIIPLEINVIEAAHGWITRYYPYRHEHVATLIEYELYNISTNDVIYDGFNVEMLDFSCRETMKFNNLEEIIIEPRSTFHRRMYIILRCRQFSESDGDSVRVVFAARGRYCHSYRTVSNGCNEILVVPFTVADTVMAEVRVDLRRLPSENVYHRVCGSYFPSIARGDRAFDIGAAARILGRASR